MAQKKFDIPKIEVPLHQDRFQKRVGETVDRLRDEMPKRSNQIAIFVVIAVVLAGAIFYSQQGKEGASRGEAEKLGGALAAHYTGDWGSEQAELEKYLSGNPTDKLGRAKAELLLGNLAYQQRDFEKAEQTFRSAASNGSGVPLIAAAARHGLASTLMQKKEWDAAAAEWERFVSDYGKRRGDARMQASGKDGVDEVALVPDALYKLAVVRIELGQPEKARVACERILKSYSDSRLATQAEKLIGDL